MTNLSLTMSSKEYRRISEEVSADLNYLLINLCQKRDFQKFLPIISVYTSKAVHRNGVQFYAGFQAAGVRGDWKKYWIVPVLIELIMLWAYKTNRIVDHKQETWETPERVKSTLLEHDLILSLILVLKKQCKKDLASHYEFFCELVDKMIAKLGEGFWLEQEKLNLSNLSKEELLDCWSANYLKRNIYFNLVYDYAPLVGYWLATGDQNTFKDYEKSMPFRIRPSHVGQVINDLGDCTSVYDKNVKSYQDQYSDIRNMIVSYPIHALIDSQTVKTALEDPRRTRDINWRKEFLGEIGKHGVEKRVMKIGQECYQKNILFWQKRLQKTDPLLWRTYSIFRDNKYFTELNQKPGRNF